MTARQLAIALLINGYIIDGLGVDNTLGINQPEGSMETIILLLAIIPIIGAFFAFYCIYKYPLSEGRMYSIRDELEARRGVN